jgi:acyl carrier protein
MTERSANPGRRLTEMVEAMLAKHGIGRPVAVEEQLTDVGLTSLDMTNLMLAMEAEFDITIPAADLTAANFRSIASLESMILRIPTGTSSTAAAVAAGGFASH